MLTPIFSKRGPEPPVDSPYAAVTRRSLMARVPLLKQPTMPEEVAAVILEAVTTATPRLRWPTDSESTAILRNRPAMADEDWMALFAIERDDEYLAAIGNVWGEKGILFTT